MTWSRTCAVPARLRGIVGAKVPSVNSVGRIYALMDSQPLRDLVRDIAHPLKRNQALTSHEDWYVAAVDGHEFFSSRKRCCPDCQTRTLTVNGETVTEYYHRGAVCHLIAQDLALVLDVELLRPGEGEETAAKRLLSQTGVQQLPPLLRRGGRGRAVLRRAVYQLLLGPS